MNYALYNPKSYAFDFEYIPINYSVGDALSVFEPGQTTKHNQTIDPNNITVWFDNTKVFENGSATAPGITFTVGTYFLRVNAGADGINNSHVDLYYNTEINTESNRGKVTNSSVYRVSIGPSPINNNPIINHKITYIDSDDLTHTLDISNYEHLIIYADNYLLFNKGNDLKSNFATTFEDGDLIITSFSNQIVLSSDGSLTWDIESISRLVIIESNLPIKTQMIFPGKTDHNITQINQNYAVLYYNEQMIYNGRKIDPTDNYSFNFQSTDFRITKGPTGAPRERAILYITNILGSRLDITTSTSFVAPFTNELVMIWIDSTSILYFEDYYESSSDVSLLLSETNKVTIFADQTTTSTSSNLRNYFPNFVHGNYYKITYEFQSGSIQFPGGFYPFYVNSNNFIYVSSGSTRNIHSLIIKWDGNFDSIKINYNQADFKGEFSYRLYIDDVTVHKVSFNNVPTTLSSMLSSNRLLNSFSGFFDDQYVEHYGYAEDPTQAYESTNPNYTVLGYYSPEGFFDFDDPITESYELTPLIVPSYDHKVTFNSNLGSDLNIIQVFDNQKISQPPSPVRPGYSFVGWYKLPIEQLNGLSTQEIFEESTIPALENLVTNGNFSDGTTGWTSSANTFTVTNGIATVIETTADRGNIQSVLSSSIENQVLYYKYRMKINSLSGGTIDFRLIDNAFNVRLNVTNNTVGSWFVRSGGFNATSLVQRVMIIDSASGLTWNYELDYIQLFNLTASHGVTATSGTAYDNAVADIEAMLALNGGYISGSVFNFYKWGRDNGLTKSQMDYWYDIYQREINQEDLSDLLNGTPFNFNEPITSDTYLVAKWVPNPLGTFSVSFNSNGGSYLAPTTVLENELVQRPSDPFRQGYNFVGWFKDIQLTQPYDFTEVATTDIVLYARWQIPPTPPTPPTTPIEETFFYQNWIYIAIVVFLGGTVIFGFGIKKGSKKKKFRKAW